MTTAQRREDGQRLEERAARMKEAVDGMWNTSNTKAERTLLKLNSCLVYQIAHVVSNTLKHTRAEPVFTAMTVGAMIAAIAEAHHELTGEEFEQYASSTALGEAWK